MVPVFSLVEVTVACVKDVSGLLKLENDCRVRVEKLEVHLR